MWQGPFLGPWLPMQQSNQPAVQREHRAQGEIVSFLEQVVCGLAVCLSIPLGDGGGDGKPTSCELLLFQLALQIRFVHHVK